MTAFECDLCVFRKLNRRDPIPNSATDQNLTTCIRRVILDAFWARASSTVKNNANKVDEMLALSQTLGLPGPFDVPGPFPYYDHCGYQVAILTVFSSVGPGAYSPTHKQWDTIRRMRTAYSNQV